MKKKVGILTIHDAPNYGACIQAFALYKYIELKGFDCELIDLRRPEHNDYIPTKKFELYCTKRASYKHRLKLAVMQLLNRSPIQRYYVYSPAAKEKFDKFNEQIKMSKPYRGIEELYGNPPEYDLYVTGSDQVWNPSQPYCLEPYFLTFVRNGKPKISYAASIGIDKLTKKEKADFNNWLSSYIAISVREQQAKSILESFTEYEIEQVMDPTFLLPLSFWTSLAIAPKVSKPYILLYSIKYNPILLRFCIRLSKESGLQLIYLEQIQPEVTNAEYMPETDAGPEEFLGYIENAEMVITNSFHGTVFSIIFAIKNFYSYIAPNNNRGSRIVDLLSMCQLSNHILSEELNETFSQLNSNTIIWGKVNELLQVERQKSSCFMERCLTFVV